MKRKKNYCLESKEKREEKLNKCLRKENVKKKNSLVRLHIFLFLLAFVPISSTYWARSCCTLSIVHSFNERRNLVSSHSEMRVLRSQLRSDFKLELRRKTFTIAEIIFTRLFSRSRNRSRWEKYFLSCFKLIAPRYAEIVEDLKCRLSSTVINCWEQIAF